MEEKLLLILAQFLNQAGTVLNYQSDDNCIKFNLYFLDVMRHGITKELHIYKRDDNFNETVEHVINDLKIFVK